MDLLRRTKNKRILVQSRMKPLCFPERTVPPRNWGLRAQQSLPFKMIKLLLPQSILLSDLLRNIFTLSDSRIHQKSWFQCKWRMSNFFPEHFHFRKGFLEKNYSFLLKEMARIKIRCYDQSTDVLFPLTWKQQHKEWFYKLDIQLRQTLEVREFTLGVTHISCFSWI